MFDEKMSDIELYRFSNTQKLADIEEYFRDLRKRKLKQKLRDLEEDKDLEFTDCKVWN